MATETLLQAPNSSSSPSVPATYPSETAALPSANLITPASTATFTNKPAMHGTINTARPPVPGERVDAYSPDYDDPLDNGCPMPGGVDRGSGSSGASYGSNVKILLVGLATTFRSPKEFFDRTRFGLPGNWEHVVTRSKSNVAHFKSNYIAIGLLLTLYFLIQHLILVLSVVGLLFAFSWINQLDENATVLIGPFKATKRHLWMGLGIFALGLLFFSGAPSIIFSLLAATGFVCGIHAVFYEPTQQYHLQSEAFPGDFESV